ncbi:hypothetical protein [Pseudonocardia ammonioxydans]|uniref:hypothetical protein n=1 Tax=Pseudonocardia ammonioxydans TaxID=260086 RepID=UPI001160AEA0|nr:hypothetical protein [Pseudonocardia ammonioxydans]
MDSGATGSAVGGAGVDAAGSAAGIEGADGNEVAEWPEVVGPEVVGLAAAVGLGDAASVAGRGGEGS